MRRKLMVKIQPIQKINILESETEGKQNSNEEREKQMKNIVRQSPSRYLHSWYYP